MNRTRRGFTLAEMMAVLAVLSIVMGSVGLIMHMLMRTNRTMQDAIYVRRQTEQFAWQLRRDAHEASKAALEKVASRDKAKRILQLEYPDLHGVIYRIENERIDRIEQRGGKIVRRESYHVVPREDLGWQLDSQKGHLLLSVALYPMAGLGIARSAHADPIRIVTAVDLTHTIQAKQRKAK